MAMDISLKSCKTSATELKATSTRANRAEHIDVLNFYQKLISPKNVLTKKSAGERQYSPIEIEIGVDENAPLWFQTAYESNTIEKMEFQFWHINDVGAHEPYFQITLSAVQIASIEVGTAFGDDEKSSRTLKVSEEDSMEKMKLRLVFDGIVWEHLVANTVAQDSWTGKYA